jgi:hypothetical protein
MEKSKIDLQARRLLLVTLRKRISPVAFADLWVVEPPSVDYKK